MTPQKDKAFAFKALHDLPGMFVLPNPWDAGSARILAGLGFKALASTSAGFAASTGVADYNITRDMKLAHVRQLCAATPLPLTADLENGFGHSPETCAETIRLGAEAGLVGGSIEDFTDDAARPQYAIAEAADRVRAAVEAAKALPFPFLVTARAENFFTGTPDLADTITRLQAYQEAGAHVLYAPGLQTLDDIRSVLGAVDRPLNVLLGPRAGFVPMAELEALGVKRVSMGSVLANTAYGALVRAGEELLGPGTLGFLKAAASGKDLADLMAKGADS
ncbi:MAG: isocitrate lyase/phosphoenolpyruvate mutase family protein [Pseudomonadota bacterium]